ncbi:MAG: nicotinate phosphoribosyltransferase [Actinomycetales bacterium]|nr:nicotinate phosphoribosyltransferase [Actinomycetales bacterium]
MTSSALLTDHYELTMLQAALRNQTAHRQSVFEVFSRRLSGRRRYGLLAGTGRILDELARFRFGDDEISHLSDANVVDDATCEWLANYRFTGSISGYAEGEVYFPGSPVLQVEGTFAEGVILETLILSILNYDSAIASAASRMTRAAKNRPCIEMGSRRAHEQAAVAAARAAYIAGFSATSNLEAGRRFAIPTTGTAAHSFTLLHDSEREAFQAQVDALGVETTLLVDTYDTAQGIRTAVEVAGTGLGAIRLDSGDLAQEARDARVLLDSLGATSTRIIVTSDLDEYAIAALEAAPVDGYGVGTSLVTGSSVPTSGFVYKLVSRQGDDGTWVPVAKRSTGKMSMGGRKHALRRLDENQIATAEVIGIDRIATNDGNDRNLMVELVRGGERVDHRTVVDARAHAAMALAELPASAHRLSTGDPAIVTIIEEDS